MPGRLGDDPLSRKRSSKPKDSSVPSAPAARQTSHNDVFFMRRTDGLGDTPDQQSHDLGGAVDTVERPEITEVGDIVRTAQAAMNSQGAEELAKPTPMEESPHALPEEHVEQAPPTLTEPAPMIEPPHSATEEEAAPAQDRPQPEPQKSGGFFKRLFGRLGK